ATPYGVAGGRDAAPELLQLAWTEDELPHRRLPAAEDEVVRPEAGNLDLRLLECEEVLDRLRQRPVPVLERRLELAQLVLGLGEGEAPVDVDPQRLGRHVLLGNVGVDPGVDAHRADGDAPLALELRDRLVQHLDIELEADGGDVSGLLCAEELTGTANLEVTHRDRKT